MNTNALSVKEDSFEYVLLFTAALAVATVETIIRNVYAMLTSEKVTAPQPTVETTHHEVETVTDATYQELFDEAERITSDYHTGYSETGLRVIYEVEDTGIEHTPQQATRKTGQTIRQLKALASKAHIKGYGDMNKAQLKTALGIS